MCVPARNWTAPCSSWGLRVNGKVVRRTVERHPIPITPTCLVSFSPIRLNRGARDDQAGEVGAAHPALSLMPAIGDWGSPPAGPSDRVRSASSETGGHRD
jgi:hypothetical protein